jgi:hypothetical protein
MGEIGNTNNSSALVFTPQTENTSIQGLASPHKLRANRFMREDIQSMSNPVSSSDENIAENAWRGTKKTVNSLANISALGFQNLQNGASKLITQSNSAKKMLLLFTGAAFFLNGVLNSIKTFTDSALGANGQQFKPTRLILALMSATFGVKALDYARGKNTLFDSFPNILKLALPLFFTKALDDNMNNPNSASYKIGKLTGIGGPVSGLLSSFASFINPARISREAKI